MKYLRVGFYGFGEAASTFAVDLHSRLPELIIIAYDKYINNKTLERAQRAGAKIVSSPDEMIGNVDTVWSLVTGSTSLQAAREACKIMNSNQVFIDFNSISPRVKEEIGKVFEEADVPMIDAAVMGSIPENRMGVSILLSGENAHQVSENMNDLGFNTVAVGAKVGEAAAIKMVRSVFAKGLEGLFMEMLLAGKRYGVQEYVIESIAKSLENKKIKDVMNTLVVSQINHSARKKSEMDYVIEVLKDVKINPIMSTATRDFFDWITSLDLKTEIDPDTASYHTIIDAIENKM